MQKLKTLTLILSICLSLYAQIPGILELRTNYFYNVEVYYLLDFDFNNARNNPDLFSYTLSYTPFNPSDGPIRIVLEFECIATVPALNMNNTRIIYILSKPFDFKGEVTITSRDLDQNMDKIRYTDGRPLDVHLDYSEQNIDRLKNIIMQTGKLPAGTYVFSLRINDEYGRTLKSETQDIVVSNPTSLELISPGGRLEDNIEIATPYPVFQWESADFVWHKGNCPSCGYWIRIAEFNPQKHSSIEEAIHDQANLPYPDNGNFYQLPASPVPSQRGGNVYKSSTTFQYPLTGAKPLEPGKTYVWQIRKVYPTTSGPETIESQIFAFKIKSMGATSPTTPTGGRGSSDQILSLLSQILSPDMYERLFSGELSGYTPTGVIKLNNQTITYEQLSQIVSQILSGKITIKSVTVE